MEPIWDGNDNLPAYEDGFLSVDFAGRTAQVDSAPVELTRKEYALLTILVAHAGQTIPRETLLESVWGYSSEIRTRTLDVHVSRLRKKLAASGHRYIETIFGVGCRFQPRSEIVRTHRTAA